MTINRNEVQHLSDFVQSYCRLAAAASEN